MLQNYASEKPLEHHETEPVIDGVVNHPAKMMTLMAMAQHPSVAFGERPLWNELLGMQGALPGWKISRPTPLKYCATSMGNAGVVARQPISHEAYSITERGLRVGVPLIGSVAPWDLDNPNFSALVILGASTYSEGEDRGTPSYRLGLYALMGPGISVTRLAEATDANTSRVHVNLEALEAEGVIDVARKYNPAERVLHVSQPDRSTLTNHLARIAFAREETKAIYEAAVILPPKYGPPVKMSGDDFLNEVLEVNPALDRQAIWDIVVDARIEGDRRLPFIQIEDFVLEKALVHVTISEEYRKPIQDLSDAIEQLHTDASYVKWARQRAYEIAADPEAVSTLMKKAFEFSTAANAKNLKNWARIIAAHVPEEGIDSRSLYQEVRANSNGRITYQAFRTLLSKLDGKLLALSDMKGGGHMNTTISFVELNI